jgi:hypothetical protein
MQAAKKMRTKRKSWFSLVGLLAGMLTSLFAGEFAPPAEGPVAFRRDRLPLEVDAMAELSKQVEALARGLDSKNAVNRRGAAQMLALALALDPANAGARELISEYKEDRHEPVGKGGQLEISRARIWQSIAWLETPEAGSDGQALAACLKDVIIISDPKHPKAEALREGGERAAWAGWIPDISSYERKVIVKNDKPKDPKPDSELPEKGGILLEKAEVQTLLWQTSGEAGSANWILAPAPLQMSAKRVKSGQDGDSMFSIMIGGSQDSGSFNRMENSLKALLRKQGWDLPQGGQIQITSKEFEKSLQAKRRQSISAAVAVLASAAITGREPEGIIIGRIDEAGAFKLPSRFWYQLQALGTGKGQRLVLPAEAADYTPSILALEKPEFFLEYEVLFASDFKQLLEMTAKAPEEPLASATSKFREIRERAGAQAVRTYIGNSFVKQRLAALQQSLPSHVSAKMLLVQASGNRPTWISRKVLAAELRRALEPMAWIAAMKDFSGESKELGNVGGTYESCRSMVDGLERYAEKGDRDLLSQSLEVVTAIRTLDRASRSRGETYIVMGVVKSAHANLIGLYTPLVATLAVESGEDPPVARK